LTDAAEALIECRMRERLPLEIIPVRTVDELASTVKLFREYASSLNVDLAGPHEVVRDQC
jgi:hypothetical protein